MSVNLKDAIQESSQEIIRVNEQVDSLQKALLFYIHNGSAIEETGIVENFVRKYEVETLRRKLFDALKTKKEIENKIKL